MFADYIVPLGRGLAVADCLNWVWRETPTRRHKHQTTATMIQYSITIVGSDYSTLKMASNSWLRCGSGLYEFAIFSAFTAYRDWIYVGTTSEPALSASSGATETRKSTTNHNIHLRRKANGGVVNLLAVVAGSPCARVLDHTTDLVPS